MPQRVNDKQLKARMGYLLRRAANSAMSELSNRLQKINLRQVDASVLILIDENPQIIASRIGRTLDIRGANMVPLLRSLEERGLIERKPLNKKSHGLHLTDEGRALLARSREILDAYEQELEEAIPQKDRASTAAALEAIWRANGG